MVSFYRGFSLLLLLTFTFGSGILSQSVGIGTTAPHASAQLDIVSSTKGLGIPSMTTVQRLAIASPKAGLFVFDLTLQTLFMYNGNNWVFFQTSPEPNQSIPIGLIPDDGEVGDRFGWSVDISGNYAIIGAPRDNIGANPDQGSAYIFFFNDTGWVQQAKLTASNGLANDGFGYSVAISGDYAIVGMPFDDVAASVDRGSAYIFVRNGSNWTQQAILLGGSSSAGDNFGYSVSISGTNCVVGSPFDDVGINSNQGTAYFFSRSGTVWSQQDFVTIPSGALNDNFGFSVDMSDTTAIIGAPNDDIGNPDAGSVHFFNLIGSNWSHSQTLNVGGSNSNLHYGNSVSIDSQYAIIGAPSTGVLNSRGDIFRFNGTLWVGVGLPVQDLPQVGLSVNEEFGRAVAVSGNTFLVSRTNDQIGVNSDGIVYVVQTDGTANYFIRQLDNPFPVPFTYMGWSLAASGTNSLIGTPYANGEMGIAYMLKL